MSPEKSVSFQDILEDIRSGMSHMRLLEKYDLTPKQLLGVFDKLIKQDRFTTEEYKSWEAGQKLPTDEMDRAKPRPQKPTSARGTAEAAYQELALWYLGFKKCPSCGEMTRATIGYCRSCNHKLPEGKPTLAESPEAGHKKCPSCGVTTSTASGYCVSCGYKLPKSESTKVVARKNVYAIAGLCLGIASVFLYQIGLIPILAVVISYIGLYKGGTYQGKESVMAWIGLALGIIFTLSYLHYYGHI